MTRVGLPLVRWTMVELESIESLGVTDQVSIEAPSGSSTMLGQVPPILNRSVRSLMRFDSTQVSGPVVDDGLDDGKKRSSRSRDIDWFDRSFEVR